jgi:hypothetical protein
MYSALSDSPIITLPPQRLCFIVPCSKDVVYDYSDIERKVRKATSNKPVCRLS